jgi:hypothetical protein
LSARSWRRVEATARGAVAAERCLRDRLDLLDATGASA